MLANLRVEYRQCPLGMDEALPRFSFETPHKLQKCCLIEVFAEDGHRVWQKLFPGRPTCHLSYDGEPLTPFTRYEWRATSTGTDGAEASASSWFETGFMGTAWSAPWLVGSRNHLSRCILLFRSAFEAQGVRSARLYVTSLGIFEASLNGMVVAEDLLTPGWTQYDKRLQYRAYDVSTLVKCGQNLLDIHLSGGWFCGRIARHWNLMRPTWGDVPMLRAQLRLVLADGTVRWLTADESNTRWCSLLDEADIYDGAIVEAWHQKNLARADYWQPAVAVNEESLGIHPEIVWSCSEPVVRVMELAPKSIIRRPNGAYIVDFGQNLVGRERLFIRHNVPGTAITVRHGEMLNPDGSLYCDNLRSAQARTLYVTGDGVQETFEPRFTFFGFRYLDITGWPGTLSPRDIRACVISSNLPPTGAFKSSDPLLNQLNSNILWGQRGNFVDIPTDCPQRDERFGWTGDTQVFMDEATWNMDCASFYTKWIADLNAAQAHNGAYSDIVPRPNAMVDKYSFSGSTGWGDAGVLCPYFMLEKYGDMRIVQKYLPNIDRWLDWEIGRSSGTYILDVATYGDWLYIGQEDGDASPNFTPRDYLSSAYLAGMLQMAARLHRLLGRTDEALRRQRQYQEARLAFQRRFLDASSQPCVHSQTALLLALKWHLFEEETEKTASAMLVKNIREENQTHLTTGFLGTPMLLDVLTQIGQVDLAYDLLLQRTYPGWLYPVTQGATTIWERWNSYSELHGMGNAGMNSFNHYAYGAVGAWFYRCICGIQPLSENSSQLGFSHFRLAPSFGHRLMAASASYHSINGTIHSGWRRLGNGDVSWKYTIPPNTTAQVILPNGKCLEEEAGTYRKRINASDLQN